MTAPADQPLTLADVEARHSLRLLAERSLAFLGEGWQVEANGVHDAVLCSPHGVKFALVRNMRQIAVGTIGEGNLRSRESATLNVFELPSRLAATITALLPEALEHVERARQQREYQQRRAQERKAQIGAVAEALDWNATSYKCHSREPYASVQRARTRRTTGRYRAPVTGTIGYNTSTDSMYLALDNLSPDLVNVIVNALHYQLNRKGARDGVSDT